jgi:hypothetical protein
MRVDAYQFFLFLLICLRFLRLHYIMTSHPSLWLHHNSSHGHAIHNIDYCSVETLKHWGGLPYERFKVTADYFKPRASDRRVIANKTLLS